MLDLSIILYFFWCTSNYISSFIVLHIGTLTVLRIAYFNILLYLLQISHFIFLVRKPTLAIYTDLMQTPGAKKAGSKLVTAQILLVLLILILSIIYAFTKLGTKNVSECTKTMLCFAVVYYYAVSICIFYNDMRF